jgi:hypothetical protein
MFLQIVLTHLWQRFGRSIVAFQALDSTKPDNSDSGGDRATAMYSLIATCKLNDIEPRAYLCHVLSRIADHPINRVDELLPWNAAAKR